MQAPSFSFLEKPQEDHLTKGKMELDNSGGGGGDNNGGTGNPSPEADDVDSSCSTPYYSAPSSPSRVSHPGCYYYSAPASPMHFVLSTFPVASAYDSCDEFGGGQGSCDFEFSSRFSSPAGATAVGSMISADELFLNGQIRPMKLSTHLQRPQVLAPLLDLEEDYEGEVRNENEVLRGRESRLRSRSLHRRARSMSPLRTAPVEWTDDDDEGDVGKHDGGGGNLEVGREDLKENDEMQSAASASASSSRSNSSSSSRNGRRWVFLKDFLYRSKSEGRGNGKEKFWQSISFHQSKDKTSSSTLFFSRDKSKDSSSASAASESQKQKLKQKNVPVPEGTAAKKAATTTRTATSSSKPRNGVGKRRVPPCERHYTTNRAQAEEMRKRTFLPYRQGLLGCLGFSSRGYGAMNGLAKTLNPVS